MGPQAHQKESEGIRRVATWSHGTLGPASDSQMALETRGVPGQVAGLAPMSTDFGNEIERHGNTLPPSWVYESGRKGPSPAWIFFFFSWT